ncbi:MAG: hypothetical protein V5A23_00995 [Halobacteriales archaeon]
MAVTQPDDADAEQHDQYYIPAAAGTSTAPGPIERAIKTVVRRRGRAPIFGGAE